MKVLTIGTFDLFHYGHYRLLKRCDQLGETIVGVNSDEFVMKYRGVKSILTFEERVRTIEEMGYKTIKNDQKDGSIKNVLEIVKPHVLAVGSDWYFKNYLDQIGITIDYLEERNIALIFFPYTKEISTTKIKERIYERF